MSTQLVSNIISTDMSVTDFLKYTSIKDFCILKSYFVTMLFSLGTQHECYNEVAVYFKRIIYFKHEPRSSCPIPTSSLFSNSSEPMRNGSGRCRYGSCNKYYCRINTQVQGSSHTALTHYKLKTSHTHMSSNSSVLTGACNQKLYYLAT